MFHGSLDVRQWSFAKAGMLPESRWVEFFRTQLGSLASTSEKERTLFRRTNFRRDSWSRSSNPYSGIVAISWYKVIPCPYAFSSCGNQVFCHIGKLIQLDSHPNELRNQLVAMTRSHPTNEKDSQTKGVFRKSIESLRDVHSTHCVLRYKSCEQRQREALVKKTQRHSGSSKQTSLRDPWGWSSWTLKGMYINILYNMDIYIYMIYMHVCLLLCGVFYSIGQYLRQSWNIQYPWKLIHFLSLEQSLRQETPR